MSSQTFVNNRYKIVTTLNHGSFGVVSLAKDTWKKNQLVALKCINKAAESAAAIDESKEEIAIHERLGSHPYIAPILDHFETKNATYLVMEYYSEGDLYEAIRAGKGPENVLEFMLQLIDAVEYAHSKGVYHRDIKPENILIAADGSVRLADWGLATTVRNNSEFGVGSERYMAPELFDKNIDSYDSEKADIWAVGICLLNILFARNPFTIASYKDKLFLDFATNREALFDIFPTLTNDVFAVLRFALTIDPDNRSLDGMRNELFNVDIWTTDDEFYDEYGDDFALEQSTSIESYDEDQETTTTAAVPVTVTPAAPVMMTTTTTNNTSNLSIPTPASYGTPMLVNSIVATNVNREPLRTPTLITEPESLSSSFNWNRTLQFTPPNPTFFRQDTRGKPHASSRLSQVISKEPSIPMEPVSEEDEVFSMDGLGHALSNIDSTLSDTSSISSIPSLAQSQTTLEGGGISISKSRNDELIHPMSKALQQQTSEFVSPFDIDEYRDLEDQFSDNLLSTYDSIPTHKLYTGKASATTTRNPVRISNMGRLDEYY